MHGLVGIPVAAFAAPTARPAASAADPVSSLDRVVYRPIEHDNALGRAYQTPLVTIGANKKYDHVISGEVAVREHRPYRFAASLIEGD